jgi:hypothetical protein
MVDVCSFQRGAYTSEQNNSWSSKHQKLIKCLDIRLKIIVLTSYSGTKSQVNFVTFFMLNARMLETMTLHIETSYYNEEFLSEQSTKLRMQNTASRVAQFHFTSDECIRSYSDVKHVHDLDVVDPFKGRCSKYLAVPLISCTCLSAYQFRVFCQTFPCYGVFVVS